MLVKEIIEGYNESVSFTNQIGTFTISPERVKYTLLRNKYYQIAKEVYDQYVSDWSHYQHCNAFRHLADRKLQKVLTEKMEEVKNDLISVGIFDVDTPSLMEYADQSGYFAEYQMAYDAFEQRVEQINGNLQYEKAKREYRKENRARWVGGTFSSRSNYIDDYMHQAELGMRNMAEGAGHTLVNAVGNAVSTSNANRQLNDLFRNQSVRDLLNNGVLNAVWNLHFVLMDFLLDKLNICTWDFPGTEEKEKAERMLGNINSTVLSDEERKEIMKEAFELNPYSEQLYKAMFDYYPEDVDNITELAEYFGCDIESEKEKKSNKTYDLPTAWLDIAPDVRWIKGRDSGVRILDFYHGIGGHSIPSIKRIFNIWGEEKLRRVLDCEIKKFKRCAKKRGKYREMPEEFFKQIGMILTAYNVVEERYGLHTGKKKLVDFIFRNVTVLWHDKKVEYANENTGK